MNIYSQSILAFWEGRRVIMAIAITPRKMPRQRRAKTTHDAIVEAAAQVIAKGGLAAFNTNAVAARAGVSIGSLYQYFPNKDAVMVALIHRGQKRQLATVAAAVQSLGFADLPTTIRTLVRAAMQHHHDDDLLASAIDHEEARLPIQAALDDYLHSAGQMIRVLLTAHAEAIAPIDPGQAARTLPALVRAVTDCWANLSPPQLDVAEHEAVRAVLGYLQQATMYPASPP
jgi:AcrR family transcriptional regulator